LQQLFADTGDLRGAVAAARDQAGAAALAAEEERQRQVRHSAGCCSLAGLTLCGQGAQGAAHAQQSASERVLAAHRGRLALARALADGRAAQEGARHARELRRRTHVLAAMSRAALREAREQAAADTAALDAMEVVEFQGRRAVPLPLPEAAKPAEQPHRGAPGGHGHRAVFDGAPQSGGDAVMVAKDWDVPPPVDPHSPRPFAGVLEAPDHPAGVQAMDRAREAFEAELEAAARMERRARAQSVANAARLGALPPPPHYARRALAAAVDARFDAELDAQRKQRRAWERTAAPSRPTRPRPVSPEPGASGRVPGLRRQEFNRFVGPSRAPAESAGPAAPPGPSRRAPPRSASPPAPPLRSAALDAADAIRGNTFEVLAQLEERLFGQAASTRGALADAQRRASRAATGPRARKTRRRAAADMSLSEREQLIAAAAAAGAQAAAREAQQAAQQVAHVTQPPAPLHPPTASAAEVSSRVVHDDDGAEPWSDEPAPEARAAGHSALTDTELAALVDLGLLSDSDGEAAAPAQTLAGRASQAAAAARRAPPPPSSSSGDGDAQSALDAMRGAAANLAAAAARSGVAGPAGVPLPGRALGDILASLSDKITSLDASLRQGGDPSGYSPRTPRDPGAAAAYEEASSGASLDDVDVHLRRIKDTLAQLALPLPVSTVPDLRSQWGNLPPPPQGAARAVPQSWAAPAAPVVDYSVFQSPSATGAAPSPGTRAGLLEDMKELLRETYAPEHDPLAGLLPIQGAGGPTPIRWSATGRLSPVPETGHDGDALSSALLGAPGTRRV
jgi:hypothetical protein